MNKGDPVSVPVISIPVRLLYTVLFLVITMYFIFPYIAMTVFGAGWIGGNLVWAMFVAHEPIDDPYAWWVKPFVGLLAHPKPARWIMNSLGYAGFIFGVTIAAVLWGTGLALFQGIFRRILYGRFINQARPYWKRTLILNSFFAASLSIYGYFQYTDSFSVNMFGQDHFELLLIPLTAFFVLCSKQYQWNEGSCFAVPTILERIE